jgi:hypothetical protein
MENKEPSREGAAKQKARDEEYQEEAEQLLKLERKIVAPNLFLGIMSVYLLFLTVLAAFGVLAYYSGHITTLQIVFLISIPLLLVAPISAIWYSWAIFRKKPTEKAASTKQNLLIRMTRSPIGTVLTRIVDNPIVTFFQYSLSIFMVILAIIRLYPLAPRLALAAIMINTALSLWNVYIDVNRLITKARREALEGTRSILTLAKNLAEGQHKIVEAHIKNNDANVAAIVELNRFVRVVANIEEPDQLDATPGDKKESSDS